MSEADPLESWLVCPKCRSRREIPREPLVGPLLCRQCSTELSLAMTVDRSTEAKPWERQLPPPPPPRTKKLDADVDDEIRFSDDDKNRFGDDDEIRVGAAPVRPTIYPHLTAESLAQAAPEQADDTDEAADEEPEVPLPSVSLARTFLSGVFTFAFRRSALAQWMILSIGLIIVGVFGLLILMGLVSASSAMTLAAGFFALGEIFLLLLVFSYAAACLVDITENTVWGVDDAPAWPEPDWRERTWYLFHLAILVGIAGLVGAAVAAPLALIGDVSAVIIWLAIFLLFPILFLSALESNSFYWPISKPIWRSLRTSWRAWIVFYAISALIWLGWLAAALHFFYQSELTSPILTGPLLALVLFSYARLMGRLAGRLMREGRIALDEVDAKVIWEGR